MKISLYWLYLKNCLRTCFLKLRYGKKISLSFLECFSGRCKFSIKKSGKINIYEKVESRDNLYLLAHGGEISIGSHCFFNINCCVTSVENITIGKNCKFGNNLVIVDHDHNYKNIGNQEFLSEPIVIGNNVWVGANCTILKGSTIGNNAVIAAGSIVKRNVLDNEIYFGTKMLNKIMEREIK